ncbi:hypothetical protein AVEN_208984-1 [Araneus ventricosus]|uniref:Uncharacterized protein n=1 Tax=Araneus ventricosus TaxID=182803 RepID=A0A4Y2CPD6_ARAVE|nr:hypothetical protein AVEN_208984-1 [Araneus ventricosus]
MKNPCCQAFRACKILTLATILDPPSTAEGILPPTLATQPSNGNDRIPTEPDQNKTDDQNAQSIIRTQIDNYDAQPIAHRNYRSASSPPLAQYPATVYFALKTSPACLH